MLLHDVNKKIVDLRYSAFDESELEELKAKKKASQSKLGKSQKHSVDGMSVTTKLTAEEIEKLDKEIAELEREMEEDRRAGRARFTQKVFIDYKGKNRRPPYHFTWVRYTPTNDFREFNQWITGYQYTPVKYGKDPFYPIGAKVNASNYWQFDDVVFVKRDLRDYLLDKVNEKKKQLGGQALIDRLNRQIEKEQKFMAEHQMIDLNNMAEQIEKNGYEVDDSVLTSLGI